MQKLESFSAMLNSLNDNSNRIIFNLSSISKLNRLKQKLSTITFLNEMEDDREELQKQPVIADLDELQNVQKRQKKLAKFRKEREWLKDKVAGCLRSIMVR